MIRSIKKLGKEDSSFIIYLINLLFIWFFYILKKDWSDVIAVILFLFMLILPLFLSTYFKVYNTLTILPVIYVFSKGCITEKRINIVTLVIISFFTFILIINILLAIKDLYMIEKPMKSKYKLLDSINTMIYKCRPLYIMLCFITTNAIILLVYSNIYSQIYALKNAFVCNYGNFNSLYYSFVTFFTVGYGDIVPISYYARVFSMSQMVIGYTMTCLFIPILVTSLLDFSIKLIKKKSMI